MPAAPFDQEQAAPPKPARALRVLLVVYAFPPAGGVGVLRAASLARYLPAEDIELHVVTTRNPSSVGYDASLLAEIPATVNIHRTYTLDLPFGIKKFLKRMLTVARPPTGGTPTTAGTARDARRPGLLKRLLQDALMPDPQVTWLPFLTRAARRIIRAKEIDLVLITVSPYSNTLLAERLRSEFPALPVVLDFRDEWLATSFDVASFQFSQSEKAREFAIRAEAAAIRASTAVVAVTEAARLAIRGRYPAEPDNKFLLLPNGFDATRMSPAQPTANTHSGDRILVTYLGSVYASTEPMALVEALRGLPAELQAKIMLRFIGYIEEPRYREALVSLGPMVELKGFMPQRDALAALNETDYVLVISHDRLNVSAKFYDYLGAGKPILACVHPDGDIRRLLEQLHAGWWAGSQDVAGMQTLFTEAVARCASLDREFQPDRAGVAQYERKVLAQRYAKMLHTIASRPKTHSA